MTCTEAEARTKWCPFVRVGVQSEAPPGVNRWKQSLPADEPWALNPVPCRCIASDCMAWRTFQGDGPPVGYCGLAGRPS